MENVCKGWEILNAKDFRDINPGDRILMGPGPSGCSRANAAGHSRPLHWTPGSLFSGDHE